MARSTDGESADSKLGPSADAPPPADLEGRGTTIKELEEAPEGLGRASRASRSALCLAICEDPFGGDGKKTRRGTQLRTSNAHFGLGSCPNWTNKGLIDAPSQDASVESNGVKNGSLARKI